MKVNTESVVVENNESAKRFEACVDGNIAFLQYYYFKGSIVLAHTEVPSVLEGQGLGGKLARTALDYAQAHKLTVIPLCPFVASYIHKHPEYQPLVHPEHGE
ncbi:MAG: N-acetyltransferase [Candidatus Dadabacteria bacterium]